MSRNQNPHKRREVNCIGIYINWDEIKDSRVIREGKKYIIHTPRKLTLILDNTRKAHLEVQVYRTYVYEHFCHGDYVTPACALKVTIDRPQKQFANLLESLDESYSNMGQVG